MVKVVAVAVTVPHGSCSPRLQLSTLGLGAECPSRTHRGQMHMPGRISERVARAGKTMERRVQSYRNVKVYTYYIIVDETNKENNPIQRHSYLLQTLKVPSSNRLEYSITTICEIASWGRLRSVHPPFLLS